MSEFRAEAAIGLLHRGKKICNGIPEIVGLYTVPGEDMPAMAEIRIAVSQITPKTVYIPVEKLTFREIHKRFSVLYCADRHRKNLFDEYLNEEFTKALDAMRNGVHSIKVGPYFRENGMHYLADGRLCAVEGGEVIGLGDSPYLTGPALAELLVLRQISSQRDFVRVLLEAPGAVLMVVAFVMLTLVRSAVIEAGVDLQAVLYLVGPQGIGKTFLARLIAGFVTRANDPRHCPALFYDASSTSAAIRDAMAMHRDLPLILDDLCFSASRSTERKRRDLATQIVRQAANAADIVKKLPSGAQQSIQCAAGVILTAEFALENPSDLTRCIIVPLRKTPDLSSELSTEAIANAARDFVQRFVNESERLLEDLKKLYIRTKWFLRSKIANLSGFVQIC